RTESPTPTLKPLLFNYAEFIKKLKEMTIVLGHSKILPNFPENKRALIVQETFKMLMKHASLKEMHIRTTCSFLEHNVPYITFPGANICFQNLYNFVVDCYQSSLNESRVLVIVAEVDACNLSELRINKHTIQRNEQLFSDLSRDINWGEKSAPISIILNAEEGLTTNEQ
ncbi:525_t:CDS:2, partial [Funneliformis geosporum]